MTRTQASLRNLFAAIIGQSAAIIISFISRKAFLICLNEEYLGLSSLFSNILTVLSLAELGVGSAMVYALYKPLAENDTALIKSLMRLYKRVYRIIGTVILLLAVLFIPVYPMLMDRVPDIPNLTVIYLMYAANTGISYFFSYKRSVIICDQKRYVFTVVHYLVYFLMNAVQIMILFATKNYILFLAVQLAATLLENLAVSAAADKMYPYLREKDIMPLPDESKSEIKKNVSAAMLHKLGGVAVNSTDNIILSKFVGLAAVGMYSNYYMITNGLNSVISQFFTSASASVGNLSACEGRSDKMLQTFNRMFFMDFWIYGFCTCCLAALIDPFISLWLGESMKLDGLTVILIVLSFYLTGMRKATLTFKEAAGAFTYDALKPVAETVINLGVSIFLAKRMGAAGVFAGTVICTLATTFWIEPLVLFRHVVKGKISRYWIRYAVYTAATAISSAVCVAAEKAIETGSPLLDFVLAALCCMIVPNLIFAVIFFKTEEFGYFLGLIKSLLGKLLHRRNLNK
ncbi:MAG: lipopolysaccharide biosynthesis protein [Huintestinicola sp.]